MFEGREVQFLRRGANDTEKKGVCNGFLVVVNARESGDADIGCMRAWGLFQRPTCHPNRLIVAQTDLLILPRAV